LGFHLGWTEKHLIQPDQGDQLAQRAVGSPQGHPAAVAPSGQLKPGQRIHRNRICGHPADIDHQRPALKSSKLRARSGVQPLQVIPAQGPADHEHWWFSRHQELDRRRAGNSSS
jgi:hypothetical protein